MKSKILVLLVFVSFSCFAQNEITYHLGAGATYSLGDESGIGYYVNGGLKSMLTDRTGIIGEAHVVSERSGDFEMNSIRGLFAYRIYPVNKLSVNLGFQIGYFFSDNLESEGAPKKLSKGGMDAIAGLGYDIGKRFEVRVTYNYHLSDMPTDAVAQAGVMYRFVK